jgi:hypothetical protein
MIRQGFGAAFVAAAIIVPLSASAQGVPEGVERGAREGDRGGGPVGAIVGGTIGGVLGGIAGVLGADERPRFHSYVVEQRRPSYRADRHLFDVDFQSRGCAARHGISIQCQPSERCDLARKVRLRGRGIAPIIRSGVPNAAPDAACQRFLQVSRVGDPVVSETETTWIYIAAQSTGTVLAGIRGPRGSLAEQ